VLSARLRSRTRVSGGVEGAAPLRSAAESCGVLCVRARAHVSTQHSVWTGPWG